jgi:hypothetical protein
MICSLYVIKYTQSEKIYPRNTLFVTYLSSITSSIIYIMHTITRLRLKKKEKSITSSIIYIMHTSTRLRLKTPRTSKHTFTYKHTHTHTHTHTHRHHAHNRAASAGISSVVKRLLKHMRRRIHVCHMRRRIHAYTPVHVYPVWYRGY